MNRFLPQPYTTHFPLTSSTCLKLTIFGSIEIIMRVFLSVGPDIRRKYFSTPLSLPAICMQFGGIGGYTLPILGIFPEILIYNLETNFAYQLNESTNDDVECGTMLILLVASPKKSSRGGLVETEGGVAPKISSPSGTSNGTSRADNHEMKGKFSTDTGKNQLNAENAGKVYPESLQPTVDSRATQELAPDNQSTHKSPEIDLSCRNSKEDVALPENSTEVEQTLAFPEKRDSDVSFLRLKRDSRPHELMEDHSSSYDTSLSVQSITESFNDDSEVTSQLDGETAKSLMVVNHPTANDAPKSNIISGAKCPNVKSNRNSQLGKGSAKVHNRIDMNRFDEACRTFFGGSISHHFGHEDLLDLANHFDFLCSLIDSHIKRVWEKDQVLPQYEIHRLRGELS